MVGALQGRGVPAALIKANAAQQDATKLVDRAFDRLASYFDSMDAIASHLQTVALIVRSSWSVEHAMAVETAHFGEPKTSNWAEEPVPFPSIYGEEARRLFGIRVNLFEGKDAATTDGLVYQELANALLIRDVYRPIEFAVSYLPYFVPEIDLSTPAKYNAIAGPTLPGLPITPSRHGPPGSARHSPRWPCRRSRRIPRRWTLRPSPRHLSRPSGKTLRDAFAK